jgi:argininosuccinate synthase
VQISELKGRKVGICASGGLVSLFITQQLREELIESQQFMVDIGQAGEEGVDYCSRNISLMKDVVFVDLREEISRVFLRLVRAQAQYDGGYWNTTGVARAITVKGLVAALKEHRCTVLAHGAVHGGNDEFRFNYYLKMFAPDIVPFSPWEDPTLAERFRSRVEMGQSVSTADANMMKTKAEHSVDANVGGVSHESRELELLANSFEDVKPLMGVRLEEAPNRPERCVIRFESGVPVEIEGKEVTAHEALTQANAIAGRNGVVMKSVLENRMNGTKGRGLYESPGLDLIGVAAKHLFQATVDKDSWELLRFVGPFIARQVYAGRLHDPATEAALAMADQLTRTASGVVQLSVFKGNCQLQGIHNYSKTSFTAQQFRFAHGGQKWITEKVVNQSSR